jgi:single-strand DNA-binding protein
MNHLHETNHVRLAGRVGVAPEFFQLPSGLLARFSVATVKWKKTENGKRCWELTWHKVVAWGAVAMQARESLTKGVSIRLQGRLRRRQYPTPDGEVRDFNEVEAISFSLDGDKTETPNPPMAA